MIEWQRGRRTKFHLVSLDFSAISDSVHGYAEKLQLEMYGVVAMRVHWLSLFYMKGFHSSIRKWIDHLKCCMTIKQALRRNFTAFDRNEWDIFRMGLWRSFVFFVYRCVVVRKSLEIQRIWKCYCLVKGFWKNKSKTKIENKNRKQYSRTNRNWSLQLSFKCQRTHRKKNLIKWKYYFVCFARNRSSSGGFSMFRRMKCRDKQIGFIKTYQFFFVWQLSDLSFFVAIVKCE